MAIPAATSPDSLQKAIYTADTMDFGGYSTRDSWSAAHAVLTSEWLRAIRAEAWDEGHNHCFHVEDPKNQGNPYRG